MDQHDQFAVMVYVKLERLAKKMTVAMAKKLFLIITSNIAVLVEFLVEKEEIV